MFTRNSHRPRRTFTRMASLVTPLVGALLALGFMTAPAANASLADPQGQMEAEAVQLHEEAKQTEQLAHEIDQDAVTFNDPGTQGIDDQVSEIAQDTEAKAQQLDQTLQASEDTDLHAADLLQ